MASAKKKAAKAQKAAVKARYNPYVQRLIDDEDLRQNIVQVYESSRDAIQRLNNGKSPSKQIFDDKKLQKNVKEAAENLRDATVALREAPKKRKKGGFGRILLLGIVGGAVALAVSEGLRKKVLDALFGAEEEFEYTSTTTASSSPQQTAGTTTT
jgi:DNA-binding MarR family transcriptional regulator